MRKILSVLLSAVMIATLATGCGSSKNPDLGNGQMFLQDSLYTGLMIREKHLPLDVLLLIGLHRWLFFQRALLRMSCHLPWDR